MKRILQRAVTLCVILSLLAAFPFAVQAEQPAYTQNEEWQVLKLTNAERKKAGLPALTTFAALDDAAQVRAMEIKNRWGHTRPDGSDCVTVLEGIPFYCAGENIAMGQPTAEWVVNNWMESKGHRENILQSDPKPCYNGKHLGVGYYYNADSTYKHHWVQLFLGGCATRSLANGGALPRFDASGKLISDSMLAVTCTDHGTCYLPLADAAYRYLGNGRYTVTYDGVTATLPAAEPVAGFTDVCSSDWFAPMVAYVAEHQMMKGKGDGLFAPEDPITRAEMVTLFYRMEGEPAHGGSNPFGDVYPSDWYYDEILWAAQNGIVRGKGEGIFDPNAPITRVELAAIFARYARQKGVDTAGRASVLQFPDAGQIPDWGMGDLQWAVYVGLVKGSEEGGQTYLVPLNSATRAEAATLLQRFIENIL